MAEQAELKYVGGGRFIAGVPARDLTAAEAEQYPEAAASGLYEPVKAAKQTKPADAPQDTDNAATPQAEE